MPMQTRSMTKRAGAPHDLEAFDSYADDTFEFATPPRKNQRILDWDEDSDDDSDDLYEPPSMPTCDEVPEEIKVAFDPNHFCPSWVKCCEENLAAKSWIECNNATSGLPVPRPVANSVLAPRWPENLATHRSLFTRSQWRSYIAEICHHLSYSGNTCGVLTTEEYNAARAFMHGNL